MGENATAPDSIERILEDASKAPLAYWNCKDHECSNCPSRSVNAECTMANRIDLVNRTRALFERQLPEGVEWPRFEDGELVQIGDEVHESYGLPLNQVTGIEVVSIGFCGEVFTRVCGDELKFVNVKPGKRIKRPEHDTQAKIDADEVKGACEYFGWHQKQCEDDGGCPAFIADNCKTAMISDLLRRQRELCEREAW